MPDKDIGHSPEHLSVGGCDALELSARFGTPLHVLMK
jgi:hypothetical protein